MQFRSAVERKCPGAETLLRAVIDNDEGVVGGDRRKAWLLGQDAAYVQELADALGVLQVWCRDALERRVHVKGDEVLGVPVVLEVVGVPRRPV